MRANAKRLWNNGVIQPWLGGDFSRGILKFVVEEIDNRNFSIANQSGKAGESIKFKFDIMVGFC